MGDECKLTECGHISVVTLGTSLTNQNGWQGELESRLIEQWSRNVKVYKVALGGKTSRWGIEQVERVVCYAPHIVLIEFIINDSDIRHRLWLNESWNNHIRIINGLIKELPNSKLYLMTMSPATGVRRWLLRPRMEYYNEQYRKLSEFMSIGLIQIAPLWRQPSVDLRSMIPDGVHPTRDAVLRITVPAILKELRLP
ncbi:SGNH/GDSL hydrolase family protein [Methylorubrum extorquens]